MSTNQPPLRKPRHADGRLMSEDEIRGLEGDALRHQVGVCVMGWRWGMAGNYWLLVSPQDMDGADNSSVVTLLPEGAKISMMLDVTPDWPGDIAAAFTVDRPEWRWGVSESGPQHDGTWHLYVTVRQGNESSMATKAAKPHEPKPTPADHAKARCLAALLLAAKIGD